MDAYTKARCLRCLYIYQSETRQTVWIQCLAPILVHWKISIVNLHLVNHNLVMIVVRIIIIISVENHWRQSSWNIRTESICLSIYFIDFYFYLCLPTFIAVYRSLSIDFYTCYLSIDFIAVYQSLLIDFYSSLSIYSYTFLSISIYSVL